MKSTLTVVSTLVFIFWMAFSLVSGIRFDRGCEGYLKRAADANTVALAAENLWVALSFAEANGLTTGYTSILYTTPDEDVTFWFANLRASLEELRSVKPETSQLERTNVLMKLRETILDEGKEGVSVTVPPGIALHPYNRIVALWGVLSGLVTFGFWVVVLTDPH